MLAFKLLAGQAWGAPAAGRPPWARGSMPARAAAAKVGGAGSRLLGDEEAEAEVSTVAQSDGAGDWLRENDPESVSIPA